MNFSSLIGIYRVYTYVYPKHHPVHPWLCLCHRRSLSSRCGTPFIASCYIGFSSVTERASDDQPLGSLDDTFLSQSSAAKEINQTENWTAWWRVFLLLWTRVCGENMWHVNGELLVFAYYRFTALVQFAEKFKTPYVLLIKYVASCCPEKVENLRMLNLNCKSLSQKTICGMCNCVGAWIYQNARRRNHSLGLMLRSCQMPCKTDVVCTWFKPQQCENTYTKNFETWTILLILFFANKWLASVICCAYINDDDSGGDGDHIY